MFFFLMYHSRSDDSHFYADTWSGRASLFWMSASNENLPVFETFLM
jgi:hypothetical protein